MVDVCPLSCYFFRGSIFDGDEIIKEAHIQTKFVAHDIHQECSKITAAPKVLVFSTTGYSVVFA